MWANEHTVLVLAVEIDVKAAARRFVVDPDEEGLLARGRLVDG